MSSRIRPDGFKMKNNTKLEGEGSWGGIWEGVGEYDHNSLYNIVKKTNKIFKAI